MKIDQIIDIRIEVYQVNEKKKITTESMIILILIVMSLVSGIFLFNFFTTTTSHPLQFSLKGEGIFIEENSENLILRCYSPQVNANLEFQQKGIVNLYIENAISLIFTKDNKSITLTLTNTQYFGKITVKNRTNLTIMTDQNSDTDYSFSVISDTHNNPETINAFVQEVNTISPSFIIHCGDIVPYGAEEHYRSWYKSITNLTVPIYHIPGNHDIQRGNDAYKTYMGAVNYSFCWNDDLFIMLDTANATISNDQIDWIKELAYTKSYNNLFMFMHVPPIDPRLDNDHAMIDSEQAQELLNVIYDIQPTLVFNGHIHIFNETTHNNVTWITTGGGGGMLYASVESGGFYHFVNVNTKGLGVTYEVIPIELPVSSISLTIETSSITRQLSLSELLLLSNISGLSSFQNSYGNWRGYGNYTGILVADLIKLIGGIEKTQIIRFTAIDGYYQEFCYDNIYPNQTWMEIQGQMVLSLFYDSTAIPHWDEGPRIAFLPTDEKYSNEDCYHTSIPGQGCDIYNSAGARWIRLVSKLTIMESSS